MSETRNYPLGYSAQEAQRLSDQAAQLAELTEDVLRRAGLCCGMRVLDLGCGVGDVSLVAAKIVGSEGAVLGIDKAASSVETAQRRAAAAGLRNVQFEERDLVAFATEQKFDAIVGRFVLTYVADRVSVLRRLMQRLNPGGVVAFLELDMSQISQVPACPIFTQARRWVLEAFAAGGAELDMGTKLYTTFLQVGLPAPSMIAAHPVVGGWTSPGYEQTVQVVRSLLPSMECNGIADAKTVDVDTLAERLRQEARENDCVLFMSRVVGAWARM